MTAGIIDRKTFFIINPQAGGGKAKALWEYFLPRLEDQSFDFNWEYTSQANGATEQVRQAILEGFSAIIAIGGDGILHEVINGIIENDKPLREDLLFAFWPAGTGCDFARMLYNDYDDSCCLELLVNGKSRTIDIGYCAYTDHEGHPSGSYFINSGDAGIGAETCYRVEAYDGFLKKSLKNGKLAFKLAAMYSLLVYKFTDMVINTDTEEIKGHFLMAGVGNGAFSGGSMNLFPGAELDDGRLNVMLVNKMGRLRMLKLMPKIYDGSHIEVAEVSYYSSTGVKIVSDPPVPIELDGETPGFTPATIHIVPSVLQMLFPK